MASNHGMLRREKEQRRAERRQAKAQRLADRRAARRGELEPVEQFPTAFPNAPEDAAGIARTLSRGLS